MISGIQHFAFCPRQWACTMHGIRVQPSVFECNIDNTQFHRLKAELSELIDKETDSLRFYVLGNNYQQKVTHIGAHETPDMGETLML